MTFIVHIYTLYNMDNFSWGKTRQNNNNDNYEIILTPK